ncbi:GNAT family N-acetyltransferase [Kitasatospora sp. NPDC088548]|uniref:GNAT family N-acetyltransferase n=1 Tax=Kitasatospora sp. NPDC088548 TaxID=3364075 RepID=UPI0037FE27FD
MRPAVELFDARQLELVETAAPALSVEERVTMDRIWARETAENPALFDGPAIACVSLLVGASGRPVLSWAPVTYRYRALRRTASTWKPSSVFVTVLQPVTGGGLLVGREASWTAHPGRWQLPGGSAEPPPTGQPLDLDFLRRHAARELAEEVGLQTDPDGLQAWTLTQGEHGNIGIHFAAPPVPEALVRRHHQQLLTALPSDAEPELERIEVVNSVAQLSALSPTVDYLPPLLARWSSVRPQASTDEPPPWQPVQWPAALTTDRLRLRPVETGDHPLLRTLWSDPAVRRYLGGPVDPDRIARRLAEAPGQPGHFTVTRSGAPIGRVTVDQDHRAVGRIEVSYEFLPSAGGCGLAGEAVAEALRWVRAAEPEREIVAVTQAANHRSRRLLEKLGLSTTGHLVEYGAEQVEYVLAPAQPAQER